MILLLALGIFSVIVPSNADCLATGFDEYNLFDIVDAGGTLQISDGFGDRTIKVETFAWNNCPTWASDPTGSQTGTGTNSGTGLTTVSLSLEPQYLSFGQDGDGKCRINNSSTADPAYQSHWFPMQGLKVTCPGWRCTVQDLRLYDIDMEGDLVNIDNNLRKGALVFGWRGNELKNATWSFPSDSILLQHLFKIEHRSLTLPTTADQSTYADVNQHGLGFTILNTEHRWFTGVMTTWGDNWDYVNMSPTQAHPWTSYRGNDPVTPVNCAYGSTDSRCSAIVNFDQPLDGFVILHALEWKSQTKRDSVISVGPLKIPCGCKCSRITPTVERSITRPYGVDTGECTKKMITDDQYVCDVAGNLWCSRKSYDRYTVSGPMNAAGRYPCEKSSGIKATYIRPFDSPITPSPIPSPP